MKDPLNALTLTLIAALGILALMAVPHGDSTTALTLLAQR
ncbi:hypothetical protein R2601_12161 [Salipiger bermudensis HTCC2601]|uniref:Uncharacterized protein n=1 Tax=Salipiger bermudensis (strain DSM 26914 / JCM 13377 / KCTC 12554 / HTCC2601) TaxID=314265 RepID=Q0FIU1_SALBH|nr:hypothetical protein R2601_12161 [Salipiger bermudensis HTCC2601]